MEHAEELVVDAGGTGDDEKILKTLQSEEFEFAGSVKVRDIAGKLASTVIAKSSKSDFKLMFDGRVTRHL